jgi:hypothetical protein
MRTAASEVPLGLDFTKLDRLADDIRGHHKAVERHAQAMLDEAIAAGEKLLEAKERVRHGEYGPFLTYCGVSARSAQVYVRLARNKRSAAVLEADSIRAALDALAGPSQKPKRLNFGPLHPPSHARNPLWQIERWIEAMATEGLDRAELRRHFDHKGKPKRGLTYRQARKRWKKPYRCLHCGRWHGGRTLKSSEKVWRAS